MRKKLIVWSGGYDSTLLLNNLAKESSKENPVYAFSFIPNYIDSLKLKKEGQAQKNYLKYAKTKGYHIEHNIITISSSACPSYGWGQQKSWFTFILPYIPDECDVYFGYVQGDCIWLAISNMYSIFEKYKYLGSCLNSKLDFPFAYKEKWEILRDCRDSGIPKNCFWTCENPKKIKGQIRTCGKCDPCFHLKTAKFGLKLKE